MGILGSLMPLLLALLGTPLFIVIAASGLSLPLPGGNRFIRPHHRTV